MPPATGQASAGGAGATTGTKGLAPLSASRSGFGRIAAALLAGVAVGGIAVVALWMNFSTTLDQAANDLGAARGDLGRTQADLGKANADLAERHKQLQQFARDLADVNRQLQERQADLARLAGMRAGAELEIHVREIRTQLDYFLITKGDRRYLKAIESLQKDTEGRLREAERWSNTPRERELTAKARAGFRRLTADLASLADTSWDDSMATAVRGIIDNVLIKEIQQPASDLSVDPSKDQLAQAKAQEHWKTLQDKMGRVRSPRVRMSYDVEGGGPQPRELPFVIGVLADLSGEPARPRRALRDRRIVLIDRDNFDNVMERFAPRVVLRQPNGPPLELTFARLADFDPAAVARRLPPAAAAQLAEAVLHRPEYRRLESCWRGLHFLVSNAEPSEMLKIRVLDVSVGELADDAARVGGPEETALYRLLYSNEVAQIGGQPYALLIGDFEIGTGAGLQLLASLGAVAARVQAPFIAAAAPSLLGAESFSELPAPMALEANAVRTGWQSYRQSEAARWTGLALPRVVVRSPVAGEGEPLWMSAAWAFAVEVAGAEARYGWPARISLQAGSRVTGLPLWKPAGGAPRPTDVALSPSQGFDLAGRGFLPLLPLDDKGAAAFVDARSCHDAPPGDAAAGRLPPLLCAGHATRILAVLARLGYAPADRANLEAWLNGWLSVYRADGVVDPNVRAKHPFSDARVEVREVQGRPSPYEMIVTLRPVHQLDPPMGAPLRLVVPVPKRSE